jgi:predicted acyl esterase
VAPDGTTLLVTRGTYRLDVPAYDTPSGTLRLPLFGDHWDLRPGHSIRLDLTQVDQPYLRPSNVPAEISFDPPTLHLPTREAGSLALPGS